MPLIIEDGTCKIDADSYCSIEQLAAYADQYGYTTGWELLDPQEQEQLARRATQFINSYGTRFTGGRKSATQALEWPRVGATIGGITLIDDVIPRPVQQATCEAVMLLVQGDDLYPAAGGQVKVETVDALTTEFFNTPNASTAPTVDAALAPVLKPSGLCSVLIRMG